MNTILNSLSEADKNKSFLTIYKDGADFDIKLSDFTSAISAGSLKLLNGINLSASLTEVTDVIGTISPLQLSTTQVNVGGGTSLGRLVVKGDGTNPVARFENSSGANGWYFSASGSSLNSDSQFRIQGPAIANDSSIVLGSYNQLSTTSGIQTIATVQSNIGCALGSGNKRVFSTEYTINNSGVQTGVATGIFLNATETALNGITHNLLDLQVGGVSKFSVSNSGLITTTSDFTLGGQLRINANTTLNSSSSGILLIRDNAGTNFNRIQLGGTTSSFPAIKRNGAAIDFRLADDSAFCSITCQNIQTNNNVNAGSNITAGNGIGIATTGIFGDSVVGNVNTSAILEAKSTTKGFLMPRMTQAQILLIATPAAGLQVYNTDLNQPCFYDGTAWRRVSHSTM